MVQKSSIHQLRLVAYPIIYRVLNISQVVVWNFHQQTTIFPMKVEKERKVHQKTNWKPDRLSEILLMAQIRRSPVDMVKYPIIYRVLAPSQVVGKGLSAINSMVSKKNGL